MKGILGLVVLLLFLHKPGLTTPVRSSCCLVFSCYTSLISLILTRGGDFRQFHSDHPPTNLQGPPYPHPPHQGKRKVLRRLLRPREATETLSENPEFNVTLGAGPSLPFYHPPIRPVVSWVRAAPSLRPAALGTILCSVSLLGLSLCESPSCVFI